MIPFSPQDYFDLGAGGICVLTVIGLLLHYTKTISPRLTAIQTATGARDAAMSEIVKNNTDAMREMSRSNDNVAAAINLLKATLDANIKLQEAHDTRAEQMQTSITRIDERTQACLK